MVRILYFTGEHQTQVFQTLDSLEALAKDPHGLLWVDLAGDAAEGCESLLLETFGFHPLAVEDALSESNGPKLDDWENYIYLVLIALHAHANLTEGIHAEEIDVFVRANQIVTIHSAERLSPLERVWQNCQRDTRLLRNGADALLYRICREVLTDQQTYLDKTETLLDNLEAAFLKNPRQSDFERVLETKNELLGFRSLFVSQREVFLRLSKESLLPLDKRERVYFRDAFDFAVRLDNQASSLRDIVAHALDIYLSSVNNRMNNAMRYMAVITTLFMPLTFITGFFGMNFFQPAFQGQTWTSEIVLLVTLVGMILFPVLMWWWLKRKGLM
ncbi:MAG TPA: magnesium transporter CorA family protein [Anaerolineales bacterium]|nr:magnesium transporter CorA family protein [Anaerolineales bacterium]